MLAVFVHLILSRTLHNRNNNNVIKEIHRSCTPEVPLYTNLIGSGATRVLVGWRLAHPDSRCAVITCTYPRFRSPHAKGKPQRY
jgi:hypothetical protein